MQSLRTFWIAVFVMALGGMPALAQDGGWSHWGGDEKSQRYSALDQIDADNFEELEVAWIWRGDNYGPDADMILRSTPIYADGKLFGVAGARRTVAAIDPATGETLWTFRERTPSGGKTRCGRTTGRASATPR